MRKILVTGTAALFTAFAIAASAAPASAFGFGYGWGGGYGWHDGVDLVVEVPVYDDNEDSDSDWQDHVDWCDDHYKTYDEDSDTYAYAVGKRTRCVAPFD